MCGREGGGAGGCDIREDALAAAPVAMARLPPRALASQLLLGGLLLPLALTSALEEQVTNAQGQNPGSTTRTETIGLRSAYQNTTHEPDDSHPILTCSAQCPHCPPVPICPSPCAACPTCKKTIPPGYEHFPGVGYYRLHTFPLDWVAAKATCEREGAHLAIINSQEEANLMVNLFHRDLKIGRVVHLGFYDIYEEGKYVTVFGQPLATTGYTKWDVGQPDNAGGNENCGSMFPSGGINDVGCGAKYPFVCELPV